jgi:hypothetical protein
MKQQWNNNETTMKQQWNNNETTMKQQWNNNETSINLYNVRFVIFGPTFF